eukprot:4691424-Alexandrium_andersonii.AAC.1
MGCVRVSACVRTVFVASVVLVAVRISAFRRKRSLRGSVNLVCLCAVRGACARVAASPRRHVHALACATR